MDRFDEIWKNRFNDSKMPISDWNSPEDDLVWDAIVSQAPVKKEKRRWLLWLWLGISTLVISILFFLFIKNNHVSDHPVPENSQVTETHITNSNEEDKRVLVTEKAFVPTNIVKSEQATPNVEVSVITNQDQVEGVDEKSIIVLPPVLSHEEKEFSKIQDALTPLLESSKNEAAPVQEEQSVEEKVSPTKDAAMVPFLKAGLLDAPPLVSPADALKPIEVIKSKKKRVALAFQTGAVYWQHRISESYTSDLAPFEFNYTDDLGWQAQLMLNYSINDYLTAFGGLQYENIESTSGHNSDLTYRVSTEQNASNEYTQDLATPYGLTRASFRFNRNQNIPNDEVDLSVDFNSSHQITNWSLPIGLRVYPLGQRQRFSPSAALGFGVNYLSGVANTIKSIDTHHDAIQFDGQGSSSFEKPTLNQWHYDLRMNLGLNYQLTPGLNISLQYAWSRGMNAVFQQSDYSTKIDRHQLSIGVSKTIGR